MRTTRALVLKRVEYGEADLVLTWFTERFGRVSALARAARKSTRRFAGALEPMHTLELALEERPKSELFVLREARIAQPPMLACVRGESGAVRSSRRSSGRW